MRGGFFGSSVFVIGIRGAFDHHMCVGDFIGSIWTQTKLNLFSTKLWVYSSTAANGASLSMLRWGLYFFWLISLILAVSIGDYPLTRRIFSSFAIALALFCSVASGPLNPVGQLLVWLTLLVGFYTSYLTLHHEF